MSTDRNTKDIELLASNPSELVARYQYIVESVVSKFIGRGFFTMEEKMDVVQNINTQLLEKKIKKIQDQFNGTVYLSTYFSKVIYNTCLEIVRSKKRQMKWGCDEVLENYAVKETTAVERMAIRDELLRLEAIINSQFKKKVRSEISFKVFARIILNDKDLDYYLNSSAQKEVEAVRVHFYRNYDHLKDKEVYRIIVALFNKIESKTADGDSLRRWVNHLVDRTIELLNGDPPMASYDRKTLKILIQYYYDKMI